MLDGFFDIVGLNIKISSININSTIILSILFISLVNMFILCAIWFADRPGSAAWIQLNPNFYYYDPEPYICNERSCPAANHIKILHELKSSRADAKRTLFLAKNHRINANVVQITSNYSCYDRLDPRLPGSTESVEAIEKSQSMIHKYRRAEVAKEACDYSDCFGSSLTLSRVKRADAHTKFRLSQVRHTIARNNNLIPGPELSPYPYPDYSTTSPSPPTPNISEPPSP